MTDFRAALSSYRQKISGYLSEKYADFTGGLGLRRKKYYLQSGYRRYRDYFKNNLFEYGKVYGKYFLFEYVPFVLAYGLMINFPGMVLLGWSLTAATIVSYGVLSYLVVYDVYPMIKDALAEIG